MSGADPAKQAREAERWFEVAARDLRIARGCLAMAPPEPEGAAYHCQQAAEKVAKALLVASATPFPKTHDLDLLADLCAARWPELREDCDRFRPLTVWNSAFRYPQPEEEPAEQPPTAQEVAGALAQLDGFLGRARAAVAERNARRRGS